MNWRLFPKIFSHAKYAPYIAIFYGLIMFLIGLTITIPERISPNQAITPKQSIPPQLEFKESDIIKLILSFLLSLGVLKIFQDMIEDEAKSKMEEVIKGDLSDKIMKLRTDLTKAAIEPTIRDSILKILESISEETADKYFQKRQAAITVEKWLKDNNNIILLKQNLDSQISSKSFNDETRKLFTDDISNCLIWLQTSLEDYRSAKFEISYLASASANKKKDPALPVLFDDYKKVLKYISDFLEDRSKPKNTGVVEDFVQKLIDYLSSEIS